MRRRRRRRLPRDANTEPHYHAQCRVCGSLVDVPAKADGQIRGGTPLPESFEVDGPELRLSDPILEGAIEYAAPRATALTTREAALRLGVNDSRVRQRLADHKLYGLKIGEEWHLPIFQFQGRGLVPNIDRVIPRLDESLPVIAVFHWFASPNPDLVARETSDAPVSPIAWLELGLDPEPVAELAAQL